jgi:hypothetical protein
LLEFDVSAAGRRGDDLTVGEPGGPIGEAEGGDEDEPDDDTVTPPYPSESSVEDPELVEPNRSVGGAQLRRYRGSDRQYDQVNLAGSRRQ